MPMCRECRCAFIYPELHWIATWASMRVNTRPETHCLIASKSDADNALSARYCRQIRTEIGRNTVWTAQWNSSLAIGQLCRRFWTKRTPKKCLWAYFEEPVTRLQTKCQMSIIRGINYGLQLICQLDHDRDPFRCNLLADSSSSFSVPSALVSVAQHPTRAHREAWHLLRSSRQISRINRHDHERRFRA